MQLYLGPYSLYSLDPGASTVVKAPKSQVPSCLKTTAKASKDFTQNAQIMMFQGSINLHNMIDSISWAGRLAGGKMSIYISSF